MITEHQVKNAVTELYVMNMTFKFRLKNLLSAPHFRMLLLYETKLNLPSTAFVCTRKISTKKTKPLPANKRIVYRSQSNNIFENLALEEWIYEHVDLSQTDILLVWRSNPCVVIGKHQNPWVETNVPALKQDAIPLARRSSGGGAVYHDLGNLNLSFLTDRSRYNRKDNLELVVKALVSRWNLGLSINDRDDILLNGTHKISGTAAKLTRNKSYHHFTLLHSADPTNLSTYLDSPLREVRGQARKQSPGLSIQCRSTKSLPSPVQNLQTEAPELTFDLMVEAILEEFLGRKSKISETRTVPNPLDESLFPGVSEICDRLLAWDWIYGKTPKFTIHMDTPDSFRYKTNNTGDNCSIQCIDIGVEKGCLVSFNIAFNDNNENNDDEKNNNECGGDSTSTIDVASAMGFTGIKLKREDLNSVILSQQENKTSFWNDYPKVNVRAILDAIRACL